MLWRNTNSNYFFGAKKAYSHTTLYCFLSVIKVTDKTPIFTEIPHPLQDKYTGLNVNFIFENGNLKLVIRFLFSNSNSEKLSIYSSEVRVFTNYKKIILTDNLGSLTILGHEFFSFFDGICFLSITVKGPEKTAALSFIASLKKISRKAVPRLYSRLDTGIEYLFHIKKDA